MDVLNPTMYLIAFGLIILIAILIARAIFSIPTIVRELKTQNSLLAEIVKMNNLKAEEKVDTVGSQLISDEDLENEALSYPKE